MMALRQMSTSYCMAIDLLQKITIIDLVYLFIFTTLLSYSLSSIWVYLRPYEEIPPRASNPHSLTSSDKMETKLEASIDSLTAQLEVEYDKLKKLVSWDTSLETGVVLF